MIRKEKSSVHWLEFEMLADIPYLSHAVFLRHGGRSQGALASFNLGYSVGDDPHHVNAHFKQVEELLNFKDIVTSKQNHGIGIVEIGDQELPEAPVGDVLMTNTLQRPLLIKHADCQAAILYDPIHHAVSNVHCGWRGNVQNVYAEAIQAMQKKYGSNPQDILACIGPSLGPQSAQFIHYKTELPESFWDYQIKPFYFDLWAISESQLKGCGVLAHHIEIASIDTFANPTDFYSYRRDKPSGRHGTVVMLKKKG